MTATIKVLKRKDAASVVVAIVVAMVIGQVLPITTSELANKLTGVNEGGFSYTIPGGDWKTQYLNPIVWAVVQLVVLELLIRLYVLAHSLVTKKR